MTLKVSGFDRLSFNNFMGDICSAAFISGCNLKCPYCHNPWLIKKGKLDLRKDFLKLLEERKNLITVAVVSGGEPTMSNGLIDFIREIRRIVPKVKLDTNGTNPAVIKEIIKYELVDYFAMDIKGPLDFYKTKFGFNGNVELIRETLDLIQSSVIKHEFRLTVADPFIGKEEFAEVIKLVNPENLIIQPFVYSGEILDEKFKEENKTPSFDYLNKLNILCEGKAYVRTFYPQTGQLYNKMS